MNLRDKWNVRHAQATAEPQAARVLQDNLHLLPRSGRALDLACGRGGNAVLLAQHGMRVDAWDISDVAIDALAVLAQQHGLDIHALVRDVEHVAPPPGQYDVIVVSYFLYRPLFPALMQALRPGGLLFYQTFSRCKVSDRGPRNDQYRLAEEELLQTLPGLRVLVYREEGRIGDIDQGFRDEVMYVGMK